MALTEDQSTALQGAVDNLNRSVEVNKEVLEILKSTGNTGVVDIATHNNDLNAHPKINQVFANDIYVGSKTFWNGEASAIHITSVKNSDYGNSVIDFFGRYKSDELTGYNAIRFNTHFDSRDSSVSVPLADITNRIRYGEESSSLSSHRLSFRKDSLGLYATLSIAIDTSTATSYLFRTDACYPFKPVDIGSSTYQWKDCYLQNSPIVSSDRRLKQDFAAVPEAVFKAWAAVNFQVYRFKEAVQTKGDAAARKHVGLVAQDIIEAFEAQGLSAFDYGIVCHDEWTDQYEQVEVSYTPAVLDAEGNVVTPENSVFENRLVKPAGDVYTVRYEEALALEAAYQRWKLSKIEQALAAKGITL